MQIQPLSLLLLLFKYIQEKSIGLISVFADTICCSTGGTELTLVGYKPKSIDQET